MSFVSFIVLVQGTVVDVVNVASHVLEVVGTVASHDHILVPNRSLVHAVTANHPVEKNPTVDHQKFVVLALTAETRDRDLIDSMDFRYGIILIFPISIVSTNNKIIFNYSF